MWIFSHFFSLNKHRSTSFLGRHLGAVCKCSCWVKPWSSSLGKGMSYCRKPKKGRRWDQIKQVISLPHLQVEPKEELYSPCWQCWIVQAVHCNYINCLRRSLEQKLTCSCWTPGICGKKSDVLVQSFPKMFTIPWAMLFFTNILWMVWMAFGWPK